MTELKQACPICARTTEGTIEKNIIWMVEPCTDCKDKMTKGFILIGAVESKTKDTTNPYRSGNVWVVDQSVAVQLFGEKPPASGVAFIDINVAKQMELPDVNMNA